MHTLILGFPLLLCLTMVLAYPSSRQYAGQQVLSCNLTRHAHGALHDLYGDHGLDIWGHREGLIDVRVKDQQQKDEITSFLASQGASCEVTVEDLEEQMRQAFEENEMARASSSADYFDSYHELDEIYAWWQDLAASYGGAFKAFEGRTVEGRQLYSVEFLTDASNPFIYFQCQIHAREWVSSPTCQYVVRGLVQDDSFLKAYNLAIVPVVNPDGYAFTWAQNGDRLWRKNRNYCTTGSSARGTDLNRNYDDHWGEGGSSSSCSSDTYMGPSAASEFEVQTTSDYFVSLASVYGIAAAIDWHSYSQLVLRPYGWTRTPSSEESYFSALGNAYASAVKATSGQTYDSIRSNELYTTTGSASDWFFGKQANAANLLYPCAGFTIELRPASAVPGFQLPPEFIIPTGEENLAGVRAFINSLSFSSAESVPSTTRSPPAATKRGMWWIQQK